MKLEREKYNYQRRLKRTLLKEKRARLIFAKSRFEAKAYYLRQKLSSLQFQRTSLLNAIIYHSMLLMKQQTQNLTNFRMRQQEERYDIAILYEDHYYPSYAKRRVRKDTLLHENTFKRIFLKELKERQ
jgi:hypothetical protein